MNRRDVLKFAALSFTASQLPQSAEAFSALKNVFNVRAGRIGAVASPLLPVDPGVFSTSQFNGDNESIPHDLLWDREGFVKRMGGLPGPSESCDVLIIGGGMAGLLTSYLAPQKDVICLEQAPNFGGNSKGETSGAHIFSQGAAYICVPDNDSSLAQLLRELSLKGRVETTTPILFNDALHQNLWSASAAPSAHSDFERVRARLLDIYDNSLPGIPLNGAPAEIADVKRLDQITFEKWLQTEFGSIHPLVLEYLQMYCWSSFNASTSELSAAQALNFVAGECGGVMSFSGGNAAIAQALYKTLLTRRGPSSLRANSFVIDVTVDKNNVRVTTFENGTLKTIEAEKAVFAAPKFLARSVMPAIDASVLKVISNLNYRSYLVANVKLRETFEAPAFDVYSLNGAVPPAPSAMKKPERKMTDVICADWAEQTASESSVLTLYMPMPFDGARQFLFHPDSHDKYRNAVLAELTLKLPALGFKNTNANQLIEGVRMTRWGHAIPLAACNFIASGNAEILDQGIRGRLFFAGQDVWANPAFETALATAERAVAKL